MPYSIRIIEDNEIVLLKFYDESDIRDYEAGCKMASDMMSLNGIHALLVDTRKAVIKSTRREEFLFIQNLRKYFLYPTRIAAVVAFNSLYIRHLEFVEEMARKDRIHLSVFPDYDSAVAWLLISI